MFPHGYLGARWRYIQGMISDNSRERTLTSSAVAAQIRAERAVKRWTVDEMAERSGIPRSTYYKLETGKRVADVSQLGRMTEFITRAEARVTGEEPAAPA